LASALFQFNQCFGHGFHDGVVASKDGPQLVVEFLQDFIVWFNTLEV
jgi:hypothetical protein